MLDERPGRIAIDEFFHGLRDRPNVITLLFEPPALWVTLQGLFLVAVIIWQNAPRFGAVRAVPMRSRRSKEEFLDALAYLLSQKGDYVKAYTAARDAFRRELEAELGLPAGAPDEQIIREAVARRPIRPGRLRRVLSGKALTANPGARAFLEVLNELETARHELCFR
jgi:hypothetical protein